MAELNCTCAVCGKKFHLKPSLIAQGRGVTCSDMCRSAYVHENGGAFRKRAKVRREDYANAVYDVISGEKSVRKAARELGVPPKTMSMWAKQWAYEGKMPPDDAFID